MKTTAVHLIHLFTERRLAAPNTVRASARATVRATATARATADTHTRTARRRRKGVWRRQTPLGVRCLARALALALALAAVVFRDVRDVR